MAKSTQLRQIAIAIVTETQPCKPNNLVARLRNQFGASHAEANRVLLELIRDGPVKRTFFGKLVVPGLDGGSGSG